MRFIAHRGINNHKYLENTLAALLNCLNEDYIAGVEFDVRCTKDRKIVLYHNMMIKDKDNNFSLVKNKTLKEIKSINPNISTLEQFLSHVKSSKLLIMEIKEESNDFDSFIVALFNILKKYRHLNLYIYSFNYKLIKKIKSKYNIYKCGLIIGYLMNTKNVSDNLDFFLYSYNYIDLINYNKEIFIFTVNSKEKLNKLQLKLKKSFYIISDRTYLFTTL